MKKKAHRLLRLLFSINLLFHFFLAFALDPNRPIDFYLHNSWTVENGLPINSVISIAQTPDGYLWLGTETGLARFDGINFDVFDRENTPALSNDLILSLLVARDGVLWIATRGGGVVRYENGTFEALTTKEGLLSDEAWTLFQSNDLSIWIGTKNGLNRYVNGTMTTIPLPRTISSHNVRALLEDRNSCLWVGTLGGGLVRFRKKGHTYEAGQRRLRGLKISALLEGRGGALWVGTMESGLVKLDQNRELFFTAENGLSNNYVRCLHEDGAGNIWIGTHADGIKVLKAGKDKPESYDRGRVLPSNTVGAFFEDREQTMWIGTDGGGLNSLRKPNVTTYTSKNGLSNDITFGVFQDSRGTIWSGTMGRGLNYLEPGKERFHTFTTQDGLSSNSVFSIAEHPPGTLWAGTGGGGVNRLTLHDRQIKTYNIRNGLSDNFVRALYVDAGGNLWAGTDNGGVHCFSNGWFILYGNVNFRVNTILKDSKGNLWAGTWGRGLCLLKDGKTFVYNKENGLRSDVVISLFEDKDGILWIGTFAGGLSRFCYRRGIFTHISKRDGLPDNTIYSIFEDKSQNLWFSSNRGIFYVNREELNDFAAGKLEKIRSSLFGKEDGMKSIECNGANQPAGWKSRDGRLWFPTTKGVSVIDPQRVVVNTYPPPVQIKQILIDGTAYPSGKDAAAPPGEGNLEILYTGISFSVPGKISFKYKLEGYDTRWFDAGTRRTAYYTRIPPGAYLFRVIARNCDGTWNYTGASFRFRLSPEFYQTLFFKFAAPLGAVFFIFAGFFLLKKYTLYKRLKRKYKHSSLNLSPDQSGEYIRKLLYLIEIKKIYKDPDVSLNVLAKQLKLNPRYLSQVINEHLKESFHHLINKYRIKEAQKMLTAPATARHSILEIAYDVGFNSKSAFNRAFKRFTQQTPSQFRKELKRTDS